MTGDDYVDVLIGRIDPLTDEKINEQTRLFRKITTGLVKISCRAECVA